MRVSSEPTPTARSRPWWRRAADKIVEVLGEAVVELVAAAVACLVLAAAAAAALWAWQVQRQATLVLGGVVVLLLVGGGWRLRSAGERGRQLVVKIVLGVVLAVAVWLSYVFIYCGCASQ